MRHPSAMPPIPWGQPSPKRADGLARILAILLTVGFFAAVFFRAGILAFGLAVILGLLLKNRVHRGRTLVEWAAAGLLVLLLTSGTPAPKVDLPTDPAEVETAQATGQLAELREGVVNLYEQIAQGGTR
jgi:hypothetical protein